MRAIYAPQFSRASLGLPNYAVISSKGEREQGRAGMAKTANALIAAVLVLTPSRASAAQSRLGTFAGFRLELPFGAQKNAPPHVEMALAPTTSRMTAYGLIHSHLPRLRS